MERGSEKAVILERLLKTAGEKWGSERAESFRSALERAAELIWVVEGFKLDPEAEPAHPTMLLQQGVRRREKRIGEK